MSRNQLKTLQIQWVFLCIVVVECYSENVYFMNKVLMLILLFVVVVRIIIIAIFFVIN